MRLAGLCRGGELRGLDSFRSAAGAVGVLFARSYERAESTHRSMISRGFQGSFPLLSQPRFNRVDTAFVCLASSLPVGAALLARFPA